MCLTVVGLPHAKQFDMSGSAIIDVGITEKEASPGSVILSQLAWANCDQNLFSFEPIHSGRFYQVSDNFINIWILFKMRGFLGNL